MDIRQTHGSPFNATKSTAAAATASVSGIVGQIHYITDISGGAESGTANIIVQKGATIIWQDVSPVGASYNKSFQVPLAGSADGTVSITAVGAGGGLMKANISGYTL